jgi:hypothetical protein
MLEAATGDVLIVTFWAKLTCEKKTIIAVNRKNFFIDYFFLNNFLQHTQKRHGVYLLQLLQYFIYKKELYSVPQGSHQLRSKFIITDFINRITACIEI